MPTPEKADFDLVRLIEQHQAGIWRYLRVLGCDAALADDLTQETFLNVFRKPFDEYSQAATASYLRTVARNLFISVQRRAGKVTAVENVEQLDTEWTQWAGNDSGDDAVDALRECMKELTDRAKMALEMRFRDKESRSNIAAALQISEHGAKNLMQRAKKQLRTCVEGKSSDD